MTKSKNNILAHERHMKEIEGKFGTGFISHSHISHTFIFIPIPKNASVPKHRYIYHS